MSWLSKGIQITSDFRYDLHTKYRWGGEGGVGVRASCSRMPTGWLSTLGIEPSNPAFWLGVKHSGHCCAIPETHYLAFTKQPNAGVTMFPGDKAACLSIRMRGSWSVLYPGPGGLLGSHRGLLIWESASEGTLTEKEIHSPATSLLYFLLLRLRLLSKPETPRGCSGGSSEFVQHSQPLTRGWRKSDALPLSGIGGGLGWGGRDVNPAIQQRIPSCGGVCLVACWIRQGLRLYKMRPTWHIQFSLDRRQNRTRGTEVGPKDGSNSRYVLLFMNEIAWPCSIAL